MPSPFEPRPSLSSSEAEALAAGGASLIPVMAELPGDLMTPVGAFLRIAADRPQAFLLESVEGGERIGRWSFLGCDPWTVHLEAGLEPAPPFGRAPGARPLASIRRSVEGFQQARVPGLPPFSGGIVGSLAYDAVRALERLPTLARNDLGAPDVNAACYDTVVAFDHLRQRIVIVANLVPGREGRTVREEYAQALRRIEEICARLAGPAPATAPSAARGIGGQGTSDGIRPPASLDRSVRANLGEAVFLERVRAAKEEIARGEIFQVVLSRRLERPYSGDPFSVYRALRGINPSPYHFYLRSGDRALAGASPEMLVHVRDGRVETRPIAGTRPRGGSESEDDRLASELAADPKENAEHLMLVDLGRNDIGRVSEPGKVTVPRFAAIERYSHVMHLVSAVEGRLAPGLDAFDALLACFPAGTVSGAPKVRAMEIIEALEPTRRGPYAGAVFYRGFDGSLDSAIAIRVVLVEKGVAYVQSGAGIVADSDPEKELQETLGKAGASLAALDRAEGLA